MPSFSTIKRRVKRVWKHFTASRRPEATYPELARLRRLYDDPRRAPGILLLGDSVAERVSRDDADQRPLGELVAARLGGSSRCTWISHTAYHPTMYLALVRALAHMRRHPELVIVPINMRCFSPQWDFHPEYQFAQELADLEQFMATRELPVRAAAPASPFSDAAYLATAVRYPSSALTHIGAFRSVVLSKPTTPTERDARLAEIFRFHYTHPLVADHRKLVSLRALCDLLRARRTKALLYITPVNHRAGTRHAGPSFADELARNLAVVNQSLAPYAGSDSLALVDLATSLESDAFVQPDIANEHLNERGRAHLAAELERAARAIAPRF